MNVAERACLELAWEAYGHATVPVGAVLVDPDGAIAATGRSRMYESSAPPGELAGSLLAHAEVNALVKLDPQGRYERWGLVSSLEPCPLCLGAAAMSTVGQLSFMGADPYGGAVGRLAPTAHTARVPLQVTGPRGDLAGALASALHVAFYLRRKPDGQVVGVHRRQAPGSSGRPRRWSRPGSGIGRRPANHSARSKQSSGRCCPAPPDRSRASVYLVATAAMRARGGQRLGAADVDGPPPLVAAPGGRHRATA